MSKVNPMNLNLTEGLIARWVAAEMVAEGVVTRKDGVLIVSASGREFMIEVRAYEVTEPQTAVKILTEEVTCPHHKPIQHRDGKPPWCKLCGLTTNFQKPIGRLDNT